ncbi:isochorismatase family cysteine hydrolase [Glutamicibacter creatinolyticus]|uniref:cysteine hydrolase family protein n=1 Tax=Glutamicibacter creatinolyticus TaxID=162496 RepID=UPI0031DB6234
MRESDLNHEGGTALVVIDMQRIFAEPDSQWYVSTYTAAERVIAGLCKQHEGKVIWTKFMRDPSERGSWAGYYQRWDRCRLDEQSEQWELTAQPAKHDEIITLPTFSKWGPELAGLTADCDHLVLTGVATDCCVLSTALGAVDAGKRVTVVADACGGATPEAHEQSLAVLGLLAPMITITTSDHLAGLTAP